MRIALVHPRLDHRGGAENVVLWMARGLRARGHDVVVATRRISPERWNEHDWDEIPILGIGERALDRFTPRGVRKRAPGRALRRALGRCDWIVAHNAPAQVWAAAAAHRMPGTRVVWFCEEPSARYYWRQTLPHLASALADLERHPWLRDAVGSSGALFADERDRRAEVSRRLDREATAQVDLVLANSAFTAKATERVYGVRVIPCLLGLPEPAPVTSSPTAPYVAWVTSPVVLKNAHGFLEAIRIAVHERGWRDLRVRAVGLRGEPFARRLRELAIDGVVHCEGWLTDAEIDGLIAGSRLVAVPSIDEPFGLVAVQAMAHGRPVLAADVGGPAETVVDGVTGLSANPLDPHAMAARLGELWSDPARGDVLGAAGRERYLAHLTFDRFLDRFERIVFGSPAVATAPGGGAGSTGAPG